MKGKKRKFISTWFISSFVFFVVFYLKHFKVSHIFFNFICFIIQYIFFLFLLGRPFQLQNCSVSNQSSDSLQVECVEGFDGGLPQGFLLELVEMPALRLVRNLSLPVSAI